ncbi:MAG: oligosaccharide flippase family protein [Weissella hellenica]|uniref:oligosaccharide flippase family protein n=1 Tax=Weissella hellenica TaxID=46256 RepID=UPI003F98651B
MTSLVYNYFWNVLYHIFNLFVPLLTMPYIARTLGPHELGIHSYTATNTQYFILIATIGVTYGCQLITTSKKNKLLQTQLFWELYFFRIVVSTFIFIIFIVFLFLTQTAYFIFYLAQSIQIIALAFDISWYYQGVENFKLITIRNLLMRIATTLSIFILIKNPSDLLLYICILSCSTLISNLTFYINLHKEIAKPTKHYWHFKKHIKPAALLLLPELIITLYATINKTYLGIFSSMTAVAYFENADQLIRILITFITASGTVFIPRINKLYAAKQFESLKKLILNSFLITNFLCFPLVAGILALSKDFSLCFFSNKFSGISTYIELEALLIILISWSNIIGVQFLIPTKNIKQYFYSVVIGACINLLLNYPCIKLFQEIGVVYATIAAELSVTVFQFYIIKKHFNIKQIFSRSLKFLISAILMYGIVLFINHQLTFSPGNLLLEILIGSVVYVLFVGIFFYQKILIIIKSFFKEYL